MGKQRPIPTKLKLLCGNPGKKKLNKNEPQPPPGMPKCPAHLNEAERQIWNELGAEMQTVGLITSVDAGTFEVYVTALALMRRVKPEIERALVFSGPNGGAIQNPYLAIYNKAKEHVMKAGAEFGLSPSSRSRVTTAEPVKEADPFEAFLGKKGK